MITGGLLMELGAGSGGSCDPPTAPVLSVNADGTIATVSSSDLGSSNQLDVLAATPGVGSFAWTSAGTRTGDGAYSLSLAHGYYWGQVTSTTSGGASVSNLVYFLVGVQGSALDHSPADIVGRLLIALSQGTTPAIPPSAWPVHASEEPSTPDEVITVYDTAGKLQGRTMTEGEVQGFYGFQVRIRGGTHGIGWVKASAIATVLAQGIYDDTVVADGTTYLVHAVSDIGDILMLGKESPTSRRKVFTINAMVSISKLT